MERAISTLVESRFVPTMLFRGLESLGYGRDAPCKMMRINSFRIVHFNTISVNLSSRILLSPVTTPRLAILLRSFHLRICAGMTKFGKNRVQFWILLLQKLE